MRGVAGTPATVREFIKARVAESGCDYVTGQMVFGDMTREESLRSIGLFADQVMPAFRTPAAQAAEKFKIRSRPCSTTISSVH